MKLGIHQLCVPDYRVKFFDVVSQKIPDTIIYAGDDYFSPTIQSAPVSRHWLRRSINCYLLGRKFAYVKMPRSFYDTCDVVVVEWNPRIISFWRDWIYFKQSRIPLLIWGHVWGEEGPVGFRYWLRQIIANLCDGIICYTNSQAQIARCRHPSLPVTAAPNACLSWYDCRVDGDEASRDGVIYVGRLVRGKKVDVLFKGFAAVCRDGRYGGALHIVGDGPEKKSLQELAERLDLGNRVIWHGHIADTDELSRIYAICHVSVSPGYVGLSLTQSFAFGVPAVIARNEPHSPEIEAAKERDNALFFISGNAHDLALKLLLAWSKWRGVESDRRALSEWTANHYSFEHMADRFQEITSLVTAREEVL